MHTSIVNNLKYLYFVNFTVISFRNVFRTVLQCEYLSVGHVVDGLGDELVYTVYGLRGLLILIDMGQFRYTWASWMLFPLCICPDHPMHMDAWSSTSEVLLGESYAAGLGGKIKVKVSVLGHLFDITVIHTGEKPLILLSLRYITF